MAGSYIGFEKAGETSLLPPLRSLVIPTEPSGEWRNLVFAFGKAGENSTFSKVVKL